jgi:8-oxo-dGTP pyrophosphatase MutT (NUDIX family)
MKHPTSECDCTTPIDQRTVAEVHVELRGLLEIPAASSRQLARQRCAPELSYGRHFAPPFSDAKPAAVMVLLHQTDSHTSWLDCQIPLTVRPLDLIDHPGQVSLPGGRCQPNETALSAAQREFEEELGVPYFPGSVIGQLSPLWVFNSHHWLQPFVAVYQGPLPMDPCPREVAEVIHLPVRSLLDRLQTSMGDFSRGQLHWQSACFYVGQRPVWGATAIVLAEMAAVLHELLDRTSLQGDPELTDQ